MINTFRSTLTLIRIKASLNEEKDILGCDLLSSCCFLLERYHIDLY